MSGHSKWSKIKRKKAGEDASRGKIFTKMIREITVCAKDGGGDPASNARLRLLIEKSKEVNMPQDNIVRAIKKGTGELAGGAAYEAYTYEGYAPNGVAVMVDTLSDNKNRTVSDLRHIFSKMGGALGDSGTVGWMFEHKGVVQGKGKATEDQLIEGLLDFDVDDIVIDDGTVRVECKPTQLDAVKKAVENLGIKVESAAFEWIAKTTVTVSDKEKEEVVFRFLEALDDLDDVQNVYANLQTDED